MHEVFDIQACLIYPNTLCVNIEVIAVGLTSNKTKQLNHTTLMQLPPYFAAPVCERVDTSQYYY